MNKQMIPTPVFMSDLKVLSFYGCWWSMATGVCLIGNIYLPLSNNPPFSAYTAEAAKCFSAWQMIRMGPLSFGLCVSVVGW